MVNSKKFIFIFAMFAFLSVALGAFGAHRLKNILSPEYLQIFETGVKYQFYHSLGGILTALVSIVFKNEKILRTCTLFAIGILFFSGSLYLLCLTGIKMLGAITPIGGVLFLLGWLHLGVIIWKQKEII